MGDYHNDILLAYRPETQNDTKVTKQAVYLIN